MVFILALSDSAIFNHHAFGGHCAIIGAVWRIWLLLGLDYIVIAEMKHLFLEFEMTDLVHLQNCGVEASPFPLKAVYCLTSSSEFVDRARLASDKFVDTLIEFSSQDFGF